MNQMRYIGKLCKSDNSHVLLLIANVIMAFFVLFPDLNFIVTEILLLVTLIWISSILMYFPRIDKISRKMLFCCFLFFLIVLFYKISGVSAAPWDFAAGYYGWLIAIMVCVVSIQIFPAKQLKFLEIAILAIVLCGIIYVTIKGNRNMQIMDLEDAISQESAAYGSTIVLFSGICFIAFLQYKKLTYKILYLAAFLIAVYMNFMVMQRGTNVIFTVLMVFLIFIYRKKQHKRVRAILFISFGLLLLVYSTGIYSVVLDYLVENSPSERVADRFHAINIFLQTGDYVQAGSSLYSRTDLTLTSLHTWQRDASSLIFGIGDTRNENIIGSHSEIIDTLARYGIIGFFVLLVALFSQFRFFSKMLPKDNPLRAQVLIIFFIFVLRNIIGNTMISSVSILLFLYMPIVCYFLIKQENTI